MDGQDQNANVNTGANNESAGANAQQNQNTNQNNQGAQTPISFDDFLKDSKNQAEFDKRVQKAIQTAQDNWKAKNDADKSEAERLAQMNETEKLQYKLQKQEEKNQEIEKKLNARDLKDEAIKIATAQDTAFDPEFLNLFEFENMTAEQLQEKTKLIKTIQDRIVEKAVNEWSKEKPPYNPDPSGNKPSNDEAINMAMGLK